MTLQLQYASQWARMAMRSSAGIFTLELSSDQLEKLMKRFSL